MSSSLGHVKIIVDNQCRDGNCGGNDQQGYEHFLARLEQHGHAIVAHGEIDDVEPHAENDDKRIVVVCKPAFDGQQCGHYRQQNDAKKNVDEKRNVFGFHSL